MHNLTIVSRMETWPLERLIPYPENARTHSRKQIWQIARSMRDHGVINPVLVDQHGNVIAGHGRILAAQFLGLPQLPVIVLPHLSDAQVRALRIADNKIAENARWAERKLHAELARLLEDKIDLTSLGFEERELQRVLKELESQTGLVEADAAPETPPCGPKTGKRIASELPRFETATSSLSTDCGLVRGLKAKPQSERM